MTRGTSGMVIATITVPTLARVSDMRAMASRIAGMDISPSEMRITTGSSHRTDTAEQADGGADHGGDGGDRWRR